MAEYRNRAARPAYDGAAVRHGRRRNTLNLYITIAAGVAAALGSLLSVNVFFNLSASGLTINGLTLYAPEQIQQVGGLVPGQNLVRLNTDYIEQRLKDNLVYIDDVSVVKDYPDKLVINVTEARPGVQIEYEGGYCLMSESGRLLEISQTERNMKLPLVTGLELIPYESEEDKEARLAAEEEGKEEIPEPKFKEGTPAASEDEQKIVILKELLSELDKLEFGKIAKIDISERTEIKMVYDGRIQIELGSSVDLDIKLSYIKAVIDSKLPEGYEGTLRYSAADRFISAIPKKEEVPAATSPVIGSYPDQSSMPDMSAPENYYGGDQTQGYNEYGQNYDDPNAYNGYNDYNGYNEYGYGYDDYNYGYDYGYDYNYGYDEQTYW